MQEVGGAVQRIHDPDQTLGDQLGMQLLAHDPAAWLGSEQDLAHQLLRPAIHVGDEVAAALECPAARVAGALDPSEIACRALGGGPGQVQ